MSSCVVDAVVVGSVHLGRFESVSEFVSEVKVSIVVPVGRGHRLGFETAGIDGSVPSEGADEVNLPASLSELFVEVDSLGQPQTSGDVLLLVFADTGDNN